MEQAAGEGPTLLGPAAHLSDTHLGHALPPPAPPAPTLDQAAADLAGQASVALGQAGEADAGSDQTGQAGGEEAQCVTVESGMRLLVLEMVAAAETHARGLQQARAAVEEAIEAELTAALYPSSPAVPIYPTLMYPKLQVPLDDHMQLLGRRDAFAAANILTKGLSNMPLMSYLFPPYLCSGDSVRLAQVWAFTEALDQEQAAASSDDGEELQETELRICAVALWEPAPSPPIALHRAFRHASLDFLVSIELDQERLDHLMRVLQLMHDIRIEDAKKYAGRDYACLHFLGKDPEFESPHAERLLLQALTCYCQQLSYCQYAVSSTKGHEELFVSQGMEETWRVPLPNEQQVLPIAEAMEEDEDEDLPTTMLVCHSNHMNAPSKEEEDELTIKYMNEHGMEALEGVRGSPAYLLAAGPPRVCDPCLEAIDGGYLPYPNGLKPKTQTLKELRALERQRVAKAAQVEDSQSTAASPMENKVKQQKKGFAKRVAEGTGIATSSTTTGVVAGVVVGGVTGFLMGVGPIGLIAGAAIGGAVGGASGASVGAYAAEAHVNQIPKECGLCNTPFQPNTLTKMPYQCRSCWVWCCDKCVPNEALQDGSRIFRPVSYAQLHALAAAQEKEASEKPAPAPALQSSRQLGSRSPVSSPSRNADAKQRSSSQLVRRLFPKPCDSVESVSKPLPSIRGHCSWCFNNSVHLCTEPSSVPGIRSAWQCQDCTQRTLRCRKKKCVAMSRGLVGYDEEFCWKCQKKINTWEEGQEAATHLVRNARCSWCFDFTIHDPMCHAPVIKVYKCRSCRNVTVPCTKCPRGDGWAMARDNGYLWKGKCALHSKHIESWDDADENRRISEIPDSWCSWCVNVSTHVALGPGGLWTNRKKAFLCNNCHQKTYLCKNKCKKGMARHANRRCLQCKCNKSRKSKENFAEVVMRRDEIYAQDWDPLVELERMSEERTKARRLGYLRPFLLLVSMEPQVRVLAAASIGIDLIPRSCFGNAHREALLIIAHPRLGMIFRTRSSYEEVYRAKSTWYTTLHRVMRATMKSTTFKDKPAYLTMDACRSSTIDILPEMELEFLEKLSHWQHLMVTDAVSQRAQKILISKEFEESLLELKELGLSTPPIRQLLSEMLAEASLAEINDDILVSNTDFDSFVTTHKEQDLATTIRTARTSVTDVNLRGIKSEATGGLGSTYKKKAQAVGLTIAAIPAGYVKLALWYFVGLALAGLMGPMGWAVEWAASIALGTALSAWALGELYLGESHEELMPIVVIVCIQRLTLATTGIDLADYMELEEEVIVTEPAYQPLAEDEGAAAMGEADEYWGGEMFDVDDLEDLESDEELDQVFEAMMHSALAKLDEQEQLQQLQEYSLPE